MKGLALLVCVLFVLAVPAQAVDSQTDNAKKRCVLVQTSEAMGTGIIVSTNLVLTNYHVIEDDPNNPVLVKGTNFQSVGMVILKDKKHDLALISTETPKTDEIEFCDGELSEDVFYVGHPMAHISSFVVPGVIIGVEDLNQGGNNIEKCVYSSNLGLAGFSGSGLWCKKHGRLIGIEFATEGDNNRGYLFSMAIPSKEIKKFLGRK